jgi:phage terminase large subunit
MVATAIIMLMLSNTEYNAVVLRKVARTLRQSVYAEVQKVINRMGLSSLFRATKSPLSIIYIPTGQQIAFIGSDDAEKTRGMTFVRGYGALIWFEELHTFDGMEEVREVLNTVRRGGDAFWCFYTYNPPQTAWSWVNRECSIRGRRADTFVHSSSYLDVAATHPQWLGQPFIDEAEALKETNPRAYEWEFLGQQVGTGGSVFTNLTSRTVSDEEIATFDRIHNGVDFGWFPDPWVMVRAEFQPAERRIIIFEEHEANKCLPEVTAEIIRKALTYPDSPRKAGQPASEPRYHDDIIWCDDTADGKAQMAHYRRHCGINARPAPKGNMRKQSYYWLAGLREIVIDPVRCPRAWEEFSLCEYRKNRQGEWLDDFPDGNDHTIDAVRYAFMNDVIRSG